MPSLTSIVASSSLSLATETHPSAHLADEAAVQASGRYARGRQPGGRLLMVAIGAAAILVLGADIALMPAAHGPAVAGPQAMAPQAGTAVALLGAAGGAEPTLLRADPSRARHAGR